MMSNEWLSLILTFYYYGYEYEQIKDDRLSEKS